jgi:hypothetical protein
MTSFGEDGLHLQAIISGPHFRVSEIQLPLELGRTLESRA